MLTALGKTEQGAERTKLATELEQALSDARAPVPSSPGRRSTTRKTTSNR